MDSELKALKGFWNELFLYMLEHWDIDGGTFQEMAERHRLLVCEKFDPTGRHINMSTSECEPDEDCYFNVFAMIDDDFLYGWFQ